MNSWRRPNKTVAAVVLILFRQQRRHKQPVEDPHQMAIGGSDLFRVIVRHGVFVPRTAAVQQRDGCTVRADPADASETARTHLDHSARIRHYSRTGSPVHFFLMWTAHTEWYYADSEQTVNTAMSRDLFETKKRFARKITIMQLGLFDNRNGNRIGKITSYSLSKVMKKEITVPISI